MCNNARPVPMLDQLKVKCRISNKLKIKRLWFFVYLLTFMYSIYQRHRRVALVPFRAMQTTHTSLRGWKADYQDGRTYGIDTAFHGIHWIFLTSCMSPFTIRELYEWNVLSIQMFLCLTRCDHIYALTVKISASSRMLYWGQINFTFAKCNILLIFAS